MNNPSNQFTQWLDVAEFITAGNAIITLVSKKTRDRYTYKFSKPNKDAPYFVNLLAGPDNTADYVYLGIYTPAQTAFRLTAASRMQPTSSPVAALAWTLRNGQRAFEQCEVWHEGRCGRCGRLLTVPASLERGIGPECAAIMGGAA